MKVWIYTHDPMLTLCYLPDEAKELFGEESLEEYGIHVPDELVKEIEITYKKLLALSRKLKEIKDATEF